jgi:hypothetical protein
MTSRLLCLVFAALALPAVSPPPLADVDDHIITLRARDALTCAMNLDTLQHTGEVVAGQLILDDAGLAYGISVPGQLSFSFRRDEAARLIDLGEHLVDGVTTSSDIAPRPPLSVFYSLRLQDKKVIYDRPVNRTARMPEAQAIYGPYPTEGAQHFTPEPGHTYLLRTRDPKLKGSKVRMVKLLVLEADEQRVVLRIGRM